MLNLVEFMKEGVVAPKLQEGKYQILVTDFEPVTDEVKGYQYFKMSFQITHKNDQILPKPIDQFTNLFVEGENGKLTKGGFKIFLDAIQNLIDPTIEHTVPELLDYALKNPISAWYQIKREPLTTYYNWLFYEPRSVTIPDPTAPTILDDDDEDSF